LESRAGSGEGRGANGPAFDRGEFQKVWEKYLAYGTEEKIMGALRKVLVVDDEEIVRLSHMRTLAGQSCSVEAARGAEEALEKMQKEPADVVLLDLRMPGMDGLAGLETIKQRWPETEVVIITGYPSVYTAREALRLGAFDYLVKPVDPDQVLAVANEAMAQRLALLQGEEGRQDNDSHKGWAKYLD
jgi:DNA-binding NtrC family response regulator